MIVFYFLLRYYKMQTIYLANYPSYFEVLLLCDLSFLELMAS